MSEIVTDGFGGEWEIDGYSLDAGVQRVRKDDVIVFRCERRIPKDVFEKLQKQIEKKLPEGQRFILLEAGLSIETVLRTADG